MARKISRSSGRTPKTAVAVAPARSQEEELIANFFLGFLLLLLAILVYYPVFTAGFIWDDDQLLTANPQVHSPDGWWTLWLKPATADYFPLTSTTLWAEWRLWGMNASGYHVVNVLMHAVASLLTWQTLKRLKIPGAWVAAVIFAVHPVCVESVAWISERKNTLSQIFFLASIINYVRFEEKGRLWRYFAALICFTLSLLAKTSVVMLPFILLILAWWRYRDLLPMRANYELDKNPVERGLLVWSCAAAGAMVGGAIVQVNWMTMLAGAMIGGGAGFIAGYYIKRLKVWDRFAAFEAIRTAPFFLVAALLGVVTIYFQYKVAIGGEEIPLGNMAQRLASACFATGFYLYSALWPFNIIEIYPQWHRAFSILITQPTPHMEGAAPEAIPYYLQVVPGLVIGGLLFYCWTRRAEGWARALLVGLGCYIVGMLPALGLLKMSYMRLTLVADHFQYISIIAVIALVVAAGFNREMNKLWLFVAAAAFALISYLNWGQTQDDHFEQIIWILSCIALALACGMDGAWTFVWRGVLVAVIACSSYMSFWQADTYHGEESLWSATLAKNPNSWQAHNHLGAAQYMRHDIKDAYENFAASVRLKPENPESHNNLGLALSIFGEMDEAIRQYQIAVGIKDDSSMETNLANAYTQVKRYDDAIRTYRHAIKLQDSNASAHCNLGYLLFQEGDLDEAIPEFERTIEIDPLMEQGPTDLIQALKARGIDPEAPAVSGSYPFDANKALQVLHTAIEMQARARQAQPASQ